MMQVWSQWGRWILVAGFSLSLSQQGCCNEGVVESSFRPPTTPPSPAHLPLSPTRESTKDKGINPKLRQYAQSITVRVLAGDNTGSGILIAHQGPIYTVVTNQHVLLFGKTGSSYRVQTPDGKIHPAKLINSVQFKDQDLGLLQFNSGQSYPVVSLSRQAQPKMEEPVLAAGFPFSTNPKSAAEFVLLTGKIKRFPAQSFGGGYQIGYTSPVKKGMSGGPLLNSQGQVIGINGVHQYPLWGNPYLFADGHLASEAEKQQMSQLSWAIPIQTFLQLAPEFAQQKTNPSLTGW